MGSKYRIIKHKNYSAEMAYFDAVIRGDGTLTKNGFRIQISDKDYFMHVEVLQPLFEKLFGLKARVVKKGNGWVTEIKSKELFEYLNLVLKIPIGVKSAIVTIPDKLFYSNIEVQKSHLRGWMDAEGAVRYKKYKSCTTPRLGFATKSKNVRDGLIKILENIGKHHRKNLSAWKWKSTDETYQFEIAGPEAVYNYMKVVGLRHPSKKQRIDNLINNYFGFSCSRHS